MMAMARVCPLARTSLWADEPFRLPFRCSESERSNFMRLFSGLLVIFSTAVATTAAAAAAAAAQQQQQRQQQQRRQQQRMGRASFAMLPPTG
jgi:hypothetical protein